MRTALAVSVAAALALVAWRALSTGGALFQSGDHTGSATAAVPAGGDPREQPFAPQQLPRIEPGTHVAAGPPAGWTRLVLKSRPKVTSGDVDKVAAVTLDLAKKFSTTVLLQVEADPAQAGRSRLGAVGIGLGATVGEEDVIVSKLRAADLGIRLGMIEGMVLAESEKQLDKIVAMARTPTMIVVDFPSILLRGNAHVESVLRHAYLVDPRDGRSYALLWVLDKGPGGYQFSGDALLRLEPDQTVDCELHVDAGKFFLGSPAPDAFAAANLPRGTSLAVPGDAKAAAAATRFTPNSAYQLELALWNILFPPQ